MIYILTHTRSLHQTRGGSALDLRAGRVLVDLACGRGGYGLEIARRSGCRVVGIDFSRVAIEHARRRARALGAGGSS
ncbi:SAM-dependent methyltransferase [Amycolatopsis sp. cmx-8-4]|uniref:SAM-dependent methyltransferase n=1 Tax=Amycolatopsis sp. cmx-8-4 TaxID=2790947 RepID=UPI00397D1410